MGKSKTSPLSRGLIGGKSSSIYGQLEVTLVNHKEVKVVIRRKPYSPHPDVSFSIPSTDLEDVIDIMLDAKDQLDALWLSSVATQELANK
ncbi:MAG: hypothetical protein JSV64_04290 [Candidatus Bathyarchaeota archaeon]|nr:MAG: hypothetical protein JSV64_04290 [Candidatus Bathyarchaeota archaeon]